MRKYLALLMLMVLSAVAAGASTWKIHNYYVPASIQNVFDTGDKVYYLNSGHLFQFDKATRATASLNRQNKLSDNQISQIYYDWENGLLFVAYASSNIDVIDANGKVMNVSSVKDVFTTVHNYSFDDNGLSGYVGKSIRDITFADGKAYVAMGFGYAVIDETTFAVVKDVVVRSNYCINSVAKVGSRLVVLTSDYTYWGDPASDDPIGTYSKKSGTFSGGKLFPISTNATFLMCNSKLYYYDFSSTSPSMTTLVNALPTGVQKSPTGYIANFAGQAYYYTINEAGRTATQHGSAIGFASSDPNGDGTVWINDASGLHIEGSSTSYKVNAMTTDLPYWLKFNGTTGLLYAGVSGPVAMLNNNSMSIANVINTYDGLNWSDATAYTAAGAGYAFEFSPVDPTTYVRSSWSKGLFKVTNNQMKTNYTSSNAKIGNYKPTPAFDNYGNLWVVCSYGNSSMPVVVLPADKFAKTTATKSDWYQPSGLLSVASPNSMQRTCFLVARKNNMKIYSDGDIPPNGKGHIFCWDNGQVNPTSGTYQLHEISNFVDQNDRQVEWTYINKMKQDRGGNVWVCHTQGVFMFDPEGVTVEQPRAVRPFVVRSTEGKGTLCEGVNVYDIGIDSEDNKWLATDGGVYFVSPDGSEVYNHFTAESSDLPSNTVYSVECDTVSDRVYIYTDNGFAEYVAWGDAAAIDFDGAYAFPNPVEPDFTGLVKIVGLMEDTYVTITNGQGQVVAEMGPVMGSAFWDCCGPDGQRVATGTYRIYAAQGASPATSGKPQATVMVIK